MEKNKGRRRWLTFLMVAVIIAGAVFYWNYRRIQALEQDVYQTQTLRRRDPLTLKGTAEVTEASSIPPDLVKGEVAEILVKSGQAVKVGDVLFTYQSESAKEAVNDARRQLERAEDALRRAKNDLEEAKEDERQDKADLEDSEEKLDNAKSRLRKAQKNLTDAQADRDEDRIEELDDTIYKENERIQTYSQDVGTYRARTESWPSQIKALESAVTQSETALEDAGILLDRAQKGEVEEETAKIAGIALVHEENKTNPQAALVDILSPNTEIKGSVTEYDYFRISLDQPVSVLVIPTDEQIPGRVSQISPVPDMGQVTQVGSTGSVTYEFSVLPERPIQPGYSVEIEVALDETVVPSSALVTEGDSQFIWLYQNGTVSKQAVTLEKKGTYWILRDGLKDGDVIISDPDEKLTEGMAVQVEAL